MHPAAAPLPGCNPFSCPFGNN